MPAALRLTPIRIVLLIAFLGSSAFIVYAILKVRDQNQIPMLSTGFLVLGVAFAAVAIGALIRLWNAASRARMRRALGLAIVGGLSGMAAIGCLTATVVLAMLWRST